MASKLEPKTDNELIRSLSGYFGRSFTYCNSIVADKSGLKRCNKPGKWWHPRYEASLCDQCKAYVQDQLPGGWIQLESEDGSHKTILIPLASPTEIKYDTINLQSVEAKKLGEEEFLAEEPNDGQAS